MICNILKIKIFSQNVRKNSLIVNTILETQMSFDIIFIQEPPWSTIHTILSSMNCKGEELVGVLHHPNWLNFARSLTNQLDSPRVLTYINIQISSLHFSLWNNILNHRDVLYISFLNQGSIFFLINVYSDSSQLALKYLKDTKTNIHNVIIMTGDFNIRDSLWDLNFPFYSVHSDMLLILQTYFSLLYLNLLKIFLLGFWTTIKIQTWSLTLFSLDPHLQNSIITTFIQTGDLCLIMLQSLSIFLSGMNIFQPNNDH